MEVKGQLISSMGSGAPELQGGQESKLQAERVAALQERKQLLEALLSSRVGELRHVCLQEAVSRIHPSHMRAPTHTHTYAGAHTCIHTHAHTHTHACTHALMHTDTHTHTHTRSYAYTHTYTLLNTHTHAHVHTNGHWRHFPCISKLNSMLPQGGGVKRYLNLKTADEWEEMRIYGSFY
ncbi:hypothetical protein NHX12_030782 [Muraenolepis orangiensis]|uniref:Cytohesin Ubiquitin Protein Inducing domain-containing protein n=1 Tax=Muraenolepis orangiensis TaxID=630683 RepID=A0A9Q0EAV8_9TELE|nr:hypothetical protein NHX12_030782 [Muraenolepis orangiensis]